MTHHTDTRSIEESVEASRSHLSETLEEIQSRMSVESIAREALGLVRSNAAAYTGSLDRAVRANPLAVAMTGIGIAWLIFGGRRAAPEPSAATISRWEDEGGSPLPGDHEAASDHAEGAWSRRIDALRDVASSALRRIEREARNYAGSARDFASERASILSAFTEDMRGAMRDGLGDMSDSSRERIIRAREAAYAARIRAQDAAVAGGRQVGRMMTDHPMIAGGLAMALGAAFASALPRTRLEDSAFGAESDRMMQRAADLVAEERARLANVAGGVADEVRTAAKRAVAAASDKAERVAAATAEALNDA